MNNCIIYRLLLIVTIFVFPAIKIILVKAVKLVIRLLLKTLMFQFCFRSEAERICPILTWYCEI